MEIEGTPTKSLEIALPSVTMFESADVASITIESGTVMLGDMVSTIVTVWVALAEFPDVSVAVHVTVVLPSGNVIGLSLVVDSIPTLSEATSSPSPI